MAKLTVEIKNRAVVIRLPFKVIECAAKEAFDREYGHDRHTYEIVDAGLFAKDLLHELTREEENGDTVVCKMFDQAIVDATSNGAQGVDGRVRTLRKCKDCGCSIGEGDFCGECCCENDGV